jgi:putative membrane protein
MYGWIIGIILIVFIFIAISKAGVFKRDAKISASSDIDPLQNLENRYARGDIDKEEYEKRKKELKEDR